MKKKRQKFVRLEGYRWLYFYGLILINCFVKQVKQKKNRLFACPFFAKFRTPKSYDVAKI